MYQMLGYVIFSFVNSEITKNEDWLAADYQDHASHQANVTRVAVDMVHRRRREVN